MSPRDGQQSHFVRSLDRGLAVISAFSGDNQRLSVTDVAEATGITRAAARRFLLTLLDLGYLSTDGRTYVMTPKVLQIGYSYLSSLSLPELARPYMTTLAEKSGRGVSIAVLDGAESVNVGRVETTSGLVRVSVPVGTRRPAFCNAMGRVLLAALTPEELDQYFESTVLEPQTSKTVTDPDKLRRILRTVKRRGYAVVSQELEESLIAVAVPVRNAAGAVVAGMNLTTHGVRADVRAIERDYVPLLQETATQINEALRASLTAS